MHDSIETWIDSVDSRSSPDTDKENRPIGAVVSEIKRKRFAAEHLNMEGEEDVITPRPPKRHRAGGALPFKTSSQSSMSDSVESGESSTRSGYSSPVKQMQLLKHSDHPIKFLDLNSRSETMQEDVQRCVEAFRPLADGVGILGYSSNELQDATRNLPFPLQAAEMNRFLYPWARDKASRMQTGTMPPLAALQEIVDAGMKCEEKNSTEDSWNEDVHKLILRTALSTSKHAATLDVENLKQAKITPRTLASSRGSLPSRVADYGITLKADAILDEAWKWLQPVPGTTTKSWNQTTAAAIQDTPLAISIETKSSHKSWAEGRPQLAIWVDALFTRLKYFKGASRAVRPAMPSLIVQGHDWYLLVFSGSSDSSDSSGLVVWQRLDVGNTRGLFDACKLIAVLHKLMDWAETTWRAYIHAIIPDA